MATKKNLKNSIIALHKSGLNQTQIANQLDCTRATVQYYTVKGAKERSFKNALKSRRSQHPFLSKIKQFCRKNRIFKKLYNSITNRYLYFKLRNFLNPSKNKEFSMTTTKITLEQVIDKIGPNPTCYLTGDKIDITNTRSYNFDHVIPTSRGGENVLDNLQICTEQVNSAKGNNTNEEFIELCKKVLVYQGYKITS